MKNLNVCIVFIYKIPRNLVLVSLSHDQGFFYLTLKRVLVKHDKFKVLMSSAISLLRYINVAVTS